MELDSSTGVEDVSTADNPAAVKGHLPECPVISLLIKGNSVAAGSCICARLRACEERVKRVERPLSFLKEATYGRDCGWDEALDAAEAAVAVLRKLEPEFYVIEVQNAYDLAVIHAVAAICALKEKP